jgi:hypothetical protein
MVNNFLFVILSETLGMNDTDEFANTKQAIPHFNSPKSLQKFHTKKNRGNSSLFLSV